MTNSGGLMRVCRWVGVNALIQKKFCSTTHLLSQHLLSQSDRWNTRLIWETCKKLTMNTPEQCHCHRSGVITVNFTHTSHLALVTLVFLLLTWIRLMQLASKSYRSKNCDATLLLFVRNV